MRPATTALVALLALPAAGPTQPPPPEEATEPSAPTVVEVPASDVGANLLDSRREAQLRSVDRFDVPHDFRFEDRRAASGIDFLHRATADGARDYKMVHYDHGNGVAVADVDGDGRLDLYFVNQVGPNGLWKNLGDGTFRDVTAGAGVALAEKVSVAASFADPDADGDPDLYVTTVKMGNVYFENAGDGTFRDATAEAGLEHTGHSSGAVFLDYDLDGDLDLFVTNVGRYTTGEKGEGGYWIGVGDAFHGHLHPDRTETSILYANAGDGTFTDVSEEVGLVDGSWSGDAAFADLDGDLYPELYLPNMQGDDHYYDNVGGEKFVDSSRETFPRSPWGTMGIDFFDHDNDGDLDLLLTDMHSDMSQEVPPYAEKLKSEMTWSESYLEGSDDNIFGNAFWVDRREEGGGEGFVEMSDLLGLENYWPWGVSVADINADGWEDVFIASSMSYPWRYGINSVLLNNRGRGFLDAEFILGVEPRAGGATKTDYFTLDCSGADGDHERCEGREGEILVRGTLGTRSAVIFDLEGDGDLDIVTTEFHALPQVLVNDLAQRGPTRWLEVELRGKQSNRDGLGARIQVTAGGMTQTRYHDGRSGYLSQSARPEWFGLGEAEMVEKVEVLWPSGVRQEVTEGIPTAGRLVVEEEGEGAE